MLFSLAIILIFGILAGEICNNVKIPRLLGYILVGILLGPFGLNLISNGILEYSSDIRQIAFIIILIRAGLSLNLEDIKKIGTPALLMVIIPSILEICIIMQASVLFLNISYIDGLILGAVISAVSPAIVLPMMIDMIDNNECTRVGLPQLMMASSTANDVFVIVLFSAFLGLGKGGELTAMSFLNIPISIVLGVGAGILMGLVLVLLFKNNRFPIPLKVALTLAIAFGLSALEKYISSNFEFAFSSLLAIITIGIVILRKYNALANELKSSLSSLWSAAEVLLFVLVGTLVNISIVRNYLIFGIIIIILGLVGRFIGVYVSTSKTKLNSLEKLFAAVSYSPKATVQAAIGGIPLAAGIASGEIILSIAVIAIILTAPTGAIFSNILRKKINK